MLLKVSAAILCLPSNCLVFISYYMEYMKSFWITIVAIYIYIHSKINIQCDTTTIHY